MDRPDAARRTESCLNEDVAMASYAVRLLHPVGMKESSRWSERSEDHRNDARSRMPPEVMPEALVAHRESIQDFWHPFGTGLPR